MTFTPTKENLPDRKSFRPTKDNLPEERSFISKLVPNIATGYLEMGRNLLNAPHNIISKKIPAIGGEDNLAETMGLPSTATLSDKIIRGLAQYAPTAAMGGAEMGIGRAAASLPMKMASAAVPNAAFGATQSENPIEGAISGAVGGAAAPLIGKVVNALRPSKFLRGNLSDKELAANQEATRGTETGLGRVIENPSLNRAHENVLPHVLGSGAEHKMASTANDIVNKGNNLLDTIRGNNSPEDYGVVLQKALKKASKEAAEEKTQGYQKLNQQADKKGLIVERDHFSKTAQDILDKINRSQELKAETSPEVIANIERYASNKEGKGLEDTNVFRGQIGEKSNDAYRSGKSFESGIYGRLKDALSRDIERGFNIHGDAALKKLYQQTQKEFGEKYAPFQDKDIVKFTKEKGADPDLLLPHFLKGGQNDRATLLAKLQSKLDTQSKHIPISLYLSKAIDEDGQVNPIKLSTLYSKLGRKQKDLLIQDPYVKKMIENYTNLVGKNKEAFNLMYNPKTGARGQTTRIADMALKIGQVLGGTASMGIPGLIGSTLGSTALGRAGTHLLTNPKLRDKLINAMLENKTWKLPTTLGRTATNAAIAPTKKEPMKLELNQFAGYE